MKEKKENIRGYFQYHSKFSTRKQNDDNDVDEKEDL